MRKIIVFIFIALVATTVVFTINDYFFKKQAEDRVLASKDDPVAKLRCLDCNVILIGIDTLRADHLSSYGYFRNTSPNIDKFVENGVLFKNTFSTSSKTTPSFMSIFTSLYPTDHGVLRTIKTKVDAKDFVYTQINDSIRTLAGVLKEQGYRTQAIINSAQLPREFGFDDGFDNYEFDDLLLNRDKLLKFLKDNKNEKFFVFFHDIGAHSPYTPPNPYDTMYDPKYNGNIKTDLPGITEIGSISSAETLEELIKLKRDYNKEISGYFWSNVGINDPRDIKHNQVYNELLKVPFILTAPTIKEKIELKESVRTVDVMPTIMDMLGISSEVPVRGKSLLPLIHDPSVKMNLPIIAMQYNKNTYEAVLVYQTIIKGKYKLIRNFTNKKPPYELYDIDFDPKELSNLSEEKTDMVLTLSNELQELLNDTQYIYKPVPSNLNLEEDEREKLESLGY